MRGTPTHRLRPALGAITIVLSIIWADEVRAESPQALLARGNRLFAAGDYAAAYEVFKKGYAIRATPVFLSSMAYSQLKLFNHEAARDLLEQYIKKYPRERDFIKIMELVSGLEIVVQTRINVTSIPPGADVYIDTEAAGKVGVTPYRGTIEPGKHTVILRVPGFATTTQTFQIQPKQTISLDLPLEVGLTIDSTPAGATVHLDAETAETVGTTPFRGSIAPGKRVVFVKRPGYLTYSAQLDVPARGDINHKAVLRLGLRVTSVPAGAKVEIDGKAIEGQTPLVAAVEPGQRRVTVKHPDYLRFEQTVAVAPESEAAVQAVLSGGLLSMRTDVSGAAVIVGERDVGRTPLVDATVPLGSQAVSITHAGRRTWKQPLQFGAEEVVDAEIKLGRPMWPVWTVGGISVAGLTLGGVAGLIARNKVARADEHNLCDSSGAPIGPEGTPADCGYGIHHLSTAALITGAVAAATAVAYYLVWARPKERIARRPAAASKSASLPSPLP